MDKKLIFGTLAGTVVGFVVSTAIYMTILAKQSEEWMAANAACVKQMDEAPMWAMILGGAVLSFFTALLLKRFGVSTLKGGAITGAWITFIMFLWFDLWNFATFKAMELSWIPIDLITSTITGAAVGAVIGWIYGKVK